jgi:hypothetical protein
MSQNSTLEVLSDNKTMLQNALNKSFNTDSTFSLSFGMQSDNNNEAFEQFNQQQNDKQSVNNNKNEDITTTKDEEIEEDKSYM